MASKKYRKKLKAQYNPKKPVYRFLLDEHSKHDRELILNYLKANSERIITRFELLENNRLYYKSSSSVSKNIKYIRENIDANIISIRGKGYQYVI